MKTEMLSKLTDCKQKTSNEGMDELPENEEQARSLVISLGLFGRNGTPKTPREQLLAHVYESHRIGRSMNKVSLVLFGESGVGKSSTVNHLFGKEVAKTASEKSETRDSKEFQIVYPDEEAKMKLTLSIIDTPGFNDSKGMSQDACNLFCIEQFFAKFHKGNKEIYPNLVFLLLKADDNRFSDDNSVFSKNLRVIQKLGLIDQRHPNVVVILTHAFSALFSPKKRENVKNKTEKINDALFQICRIRAPVVCIENDFKDLQLEEEGDYSRLPNDELQPKNLYEKMADVLEENGDRLGHAVLNQCFQKIDKTSVLIGENTTANDGFAGTLNSREMVFKDLLQKNNDVGAKGSEVGQEIQRYLDINGMDEEDKRNIRAVWAELEQKGLVEKRQFLNHTLGSLRQTLKNPIGKEAEDMFRDFFNVKDTVIKSGHILNVGMGYSIFHDKITDLPVYDHGNKQFQGTEYGLEIPKGMTIEKQNKTEKIMQVCKSKEEFVQARCSALNVSLPTIPYEMLSFKAGGGFSYSSTADSKEQSLNLSFRYEVRLFKLKMTDPLAVNKNPDFSTTFEEMVNGLPKTFDEKNPGAYDTFFSDWGQYLITSAHGGGSVELSKDVILTAKSDREKSIGEAQADITLEFSNISMGVSGFDSISGVRKCSSKTMSTNVCWEGGDVEYHRATSTDQLAANDWRKWEASIATNPVMHTTSMSLIPICQIMAKVPGNEGKRDTFVKAWNHFMGGGESKKEEAEKKRQEELERKNKIKEAITREATVKQVPKSKGWGCMIQ